MSTIRRTPTSPRRRRRWTAAEKTRHLAAFADTGMSVGDFCQERGIPPSTFALWQRTARRAATGATARGGRFAAVEVVADVAPPDRATGMRLRVRAAAGSEAEFTGLDRATAVALLHVVLRPAGTRRR